MVRRVARRHHGAVPCSIATLVSSRPKPVEQPVHKTSPCLDIVSVVSCRVVAQRFQLAQPLDPGLRRIVDGPCFLWGSA